MIIDKYENHPECRKSRQTTPYFELTEMNAHLKERLQVFRRLIKNFTFHIARHTLRLSLQIINRIHRKRK
jgi:hypothetical protein